jgi:hypothetical protein
MDKTAEKLMGFKYERKRIKREIKMPPLCPDYDPEEGRDKCKKSDFCNNATTNYKGVALGVCYGGTRNTERNDRLVRLAKDKNRFDQPLNKTDSKKRTRSNKNCNG